MSEEKQNYTKEPIDLDSLFDPIRFKINGEIYTIKKITPEMMKAAAVIQKKAEKNPEDIDALVDLAAVFLGKKAVEFQGLDIRQLAAIATTVTAELDVSKNAVGRESKSQ